MKYFIKKISTFLILILIPLIIGIWGYIKYDPFKVIYEYSNYSYPNVIPNRDYISTEMYLKNHKKQQYNSFIFGSSRTIAFKPLTWKKYLKENDNPFSFDASGESIYGIYTKIKFLDSVNTKIENALIIICRDETFNNTKKLNGHLFIKHPVTSHESYLSFHKSFIQAYFNPMFLFSFYNFKISNSFKPYMNGYIETRKMKFDTITNEMSIVDQEEEIYKSPNDYYVKRNSLFYKRPLQESTDSIGRIKNVQLFMLSEIKKILEKQHTKYKIVISPLYEQIKINNEDYKKLRALFNKNLYNFSGKNKFTDSVINYYETSHYRPKVGEAILDEIYATEKK